jgi:hypothetical protein
MPKSGTLILGDLLGRLAMLDIACSRCDAPGTCRSPA